MRLVITQGRKPLGATDLDGTQWRIIGDGLRNLAPVNVRLSLAGKPTEFALTDNAGAVLCPGTFENEQPSLTEGDHVRFATDALCVRLPERAWLESLPSPVPEGMRRIGRWRSLLGVNRAS